MDSTASGGVADNGSASFKRRRRQDVGTPSKSVQSFEEEDVSQEGHYFTDAITAIINNEIALEMKRAMEPRAKALDEDVCLLQREAEDVTARREDEDRQIREETERLTTQITRVQSTIAQFMDSYQKQTQAT